MIRLFIDVRTRNGCHQEHLLGPSFFFPILCDRLLGFILLTSSLLCSKDLFVFLLVHHGKLNLTQVRRPINLILGQFGTLTVHVTLP